MQQIVEATLSCGMFLAAGLAGLIVQGLLHERHLTRDTLEFVRLVVVSLVTFLAIVLGLLTAASKQHFDQVFVSYRHLAATLVLLDNEMREIGPAAAPLRADMRAYLAAVIDSTWPAEPAPTGDYPRGLPPGQQESTALTMLLRRVEEQLRALPATAPAQSQAIAAATREFADANNARWNIIETAQPTIPVPFYNLMRFWTALIFLGFGLTATRNAVVAVTMLICAISLASVVYVMLELDDPLGGLIAISSQPLHDALADLERP
jgi:hypothetical protein